MIKKICILIYVFLLFLCFPNPFSAEENTTPSGIPLTDLEEFVDNYVDDYIGETVAGATIIAIKDNEIVLSKGYGYADLEAKIPMDSNTSVLEWGSITKLFVWVSVMQLAEEGRLDLEEDIRAYLPEDFLSNLNFDEDITMLNLMHHNAGFEDNIFDLLYDSEDYLVSLEEALKLAEPDQVYQPGEVVAYSNYSTSLAAYIIEQITEQPFSEYVTNHIFSELEMDHTSIHLPIENREEILANKTKGYALAELGSFKEVDPFYISLYPSGGINGTAADLAKFAQALMPPDSEKSPLFQQNQTLTELLSTSYTAHEDVPGIAHGFWEYDGRYRGLMHSGNTVAFSSNLQIVPEDNFAIIVLTNQADEIDLTFGLADELVGKGEQSVQENLPPASEVEGSYLSARRTYSGLMNLYSYLTPLHIQTINSNEIEMEIAGFRANYIQTSPHVFKLKDGDRVFTPNNVMYFHVNEGEVEQISTSYADYLPMDKSKPYLLISLGLFIWCMAYFLISPFILMMQAFLRWRRKQETRTVTKWNWVLTLSGTALTLNLLILAIRMLTNPMRAYSELAIHFVGNYVFTVISFLSFVLLIIYWQRSQISKMQKVGYLLTCLSSILFIAWLILWQLYS